MNNPKENLNKPLTAISLGMILAGIVILYWLLSHLDSAFAATRNLLAVAMPLIQGMAIAYLLNLPMRAIEAVLARWLQGSWQRRLVRPLSLILTLLLAASLFVAVLMLLIPQLIISLTDLGNRLPDLIDQTRSWLSTTAASTPWLSNLVASLHLTTQDLVDWALTVVQGNGAGWFSSTLNFVSSAFGWLVSLILSLIFAIYLLLGKDQLLQQVNRLLARLLPTRTAQACRSLAALSHQTFGNFFAGQFIEALILGAIFFLILAVFGFPYALLIAVVIAATALIPMAGAYIGLSVGAFLILLINPWQALAFTILFLVVQQVENNVIYPRVVGGSIGLPAIWVLVAVVLGGGLFGVLGMILFIPLTSIAYTLLRNWVNAKV